MTFTQNFSNHSVSTKKESKPSLKRIINVVIRTISSLSIPMTISLLLSLIATFIFQSNNGASYFYNTWVIFCKVFFPSIPLMMWYIMK